MTTKTEQAGPSVELTTGKTLKLRVGEVALVGVRVTGTTARPTIQPPDTNYPLFVDTDDEGTWFGSWVPQTPGDHEVRVSVADAAPLTVTVTATAQEG